MAPPDDELTDGGTSPDDTPDWLASGDLDSDDALKWLEEIAAKVSPRTSVLLMNSPGNPTGSVYRDEALRAIAEIAVRHDLYVITDEVYARIVFSGMDAFSA